MSVACAGRRAGNCCAARRAAAARCFTRLALGEFTDMCIHVYTQKWFMTRTSREYLQFKTCAERKVYLRVVQRAAAVAYAGALFKTKPAIIMLLLLLLLILPQVEKAKCKLLDLEAKQSDDCDTSEGDDSHGPQTQVLRVTCDL